MIAKRLDLMRIECDAADGFTPESAAVVRELLLEGERAGAVTLALRELIAAALESHDAGQTSA